MTTIEILNGLRSNDLIIKYKPNSLSDETRNKLERIEQIFSDTSGFRFPIDPITVVCLYYKHSMTAEQIAEKLNISPRTVYRKRDEGIRRLSHFFGE